MSRGAFVELDRRLRNHCYQRFDGGMSWLRKALRLEVAQRSCTAGAAAVRPVAAGRPHWALSSSAVRTSQLLRELLGGAGPGARRGKQAVPSPAAGWCREQGPSCGRQGGKARDTVEQGRFALGREGSGTGARPLLGQLTFRAQHLGRRAWQAQSGWSCSSGPAARRHAAARAGRLHR